jgi:ankyrin repeat protein
MVRVLVVLPLVALLAGCGGVGIAVPGKDLRTPLEKAAQAGDLSEVERLLASGADPNRGAFGSPMNSAAYHTNNAEVIRALVAAGANPNGSGAEGHTCWVSPLLTAASMGDLENARTLLDSGASLRPSCSRMVVGWLKAPVIDLLVQHGLDIFASDEFGRNELHMALGPPVAPNVEGIEYLIHAGVPLNARDHQGKTPLAYWREPRDFEAHWFRAWLFERLSSQPEFRQQRENRAKISALLERSGAVL